MNPIIMDFGPAPYVANLQTAAEFNENFRSALWTGKHLQVVLMSLLPGEDIGLEVHPDTDQFVLIEDGHGTVQMGDTRDALEYSASFYEDYTIIIPAGKWHNITNTGDIPVKLVTIYAPPEYPSGTEQKDKT